MKTTQRDVVRTYFVLGLLCSSGLKNKNENNNTPHEKTTQEALTQLSKAWAARERVGSAATEEDVRKASSLGSEVSPVPSWPVRPSVRSKHSLPCFHRNACEQRVVSVQQGVPPPP